MRYDANDVSKSDRQTEGQLSERPLAELIREIIDADLSGAIRLSNGLAKIIVYFEKGRFLFATSNLRAHRLREVITRQVAIERQIDEFPALLSDEELGAALVDQNAISAEQLQEIRVAQVSDVLRVALLWTEGHWSFDRRVRVANDLRVSLDVERLLLESARHLPVAFTQTRVGVGAAKYAVMKMSDGTILSKTEEYILARVAHAGNEVSSADLASKGLREDDSVRAIYALCVGGFLRASDYRNILSDTVKAAPKIEAVPPPEKTKAPDENSEISALFTRLYSAKTHYDVLDVGRAASANEIKNAYHDLARRFHPDRFHQSDLRARVESAFARIGRAYETLSDEKRRHDYDKSLTSKRAPKPPPASAPRSTPSESQNDSDTARAESSFQLGNDALQRNQNEEAIRHLAEAAMLGPRVARYRAYYGLALMRDPSAKRTAENELQAALKIEPNNATFRVMLAEFYQQIGLRKRAENEATRALSVDPANKSARALLSNLTGK